MVTRGNERGERIAIGARARGRLGSILRSSLGKGAAALRIVGATLKDVQVPSNQSIAQGSVLTGICFLYTSLPKS